MTNYYKIICSLLAVAFLSSCTEIIDIDINSSEPEIVVEATVPVNEAAKVLVTKSIDLDATNTFTNVQNAVVTITDNEGNSEILTENMPGIYSGLSITGKVGATYHLSVKTENKNITSDCKIPELVAIDSISVLNSIYPGGGSPMSDNQSADFYEINVTYSDPADRPNYYRIVLFLNGVPLGGNNVYDDRFTNGNQVTNTLIVYNPLIKNGDKIMIEMQCIDKAVFDYFDSLGNSAMGPRNSSSPANPYTNLTGGLLGFFSAHTVQRKEYTITK